MAERFGRVSTSAPTLAHNENHPLSLDTAGNARFTLGTLLSGEDTEADVIKTEQRFLPLHVTADTLVKTGAGFLHTLTFAQTDAAPTAGSIIVYDNTAESGTKLFEWNLTTTVFMPFTVTINGAFATGLYVGFTTTADVAVTVSYR